MKTTIICNSLSEIKTVASFYGIEVKSSEIVVSFPYRFTVDQVLNRRSGPIDKWKVNDVYTFEDFERRFIKRRFESLKEVNP